MMCVCCWPKPTGCVRLRSRTWARCGPEPGLGACRQKQLGALRGCLPLVCLQVQAAMAALQELLDQCMFQAAHREHSPSCCACCNIPTHCGCMHTRAAVGRLARLVTKAQGLQATLTKHLQEEQVGCWVTSLLSLMCSTAVDSCMLNQQHGT